MAKKVPANILAGAVAEGGRALVDSSAEPIFIGI